MRFFIYAPDGNRCVPADIRAGDFIRWKRDGSVGTFGCEVIAETPFRLKIRIIEHDGRPSVAQSIRYLPASSNIHHATRNGKDLSTP